MVVRLGFPNPSRGCLTFLTFKQYTNQVDCSGDDSEVAVLESRAENFDVESYWRLRERSGMVQPGIKQDSSSPTPITNMASTTSTKLHNAYKGRVSAKQLSETIDDFLRRLPPATTDATPEIPWIYVANPYIPRDDKGGEEAPAEPGAQLQTFIEGGGERLELFGDFLRTKQDKGRGGRAGNAMAREVSRERDACVGDILMLANAMKVRTGKVSRSSATHPGLHPNIP